jgi:tRNA nucleotidyltransferase (CCA-adding enzyme)
VLFPEIDQLFGVPQRAEYHPEIDTGTHLLMCLQVAARDQLSPQIRFAVLMHDLGKGITPAHILPRHVGHEQAGVPLVKAFCTRYKVPKEYQQLAELVCEYHLECHRVVELQAKTLMEETTGFRCVTSPRTF